MEEWQQNVLEVIRKTREISLPQFGCVDEVQIKEQDPQNVVTEIDREVESFLKKEFALINSDIGFVGEEFGGEESDKFWLVDPIDGTGLYTHGLPFCTTQVALIENGEVVFGAVYDFVRDDLYYAWQGEGAFMNDQRIEVNDREANQAYIGYESRIDEDEHNFAMYCNVKKTYRVMNFRSAGYECALVASGKLEGRIVYHGYGKPHDFAASSILVKEAGGVVSTIGSSEYDFHNTDHIVASPKLYKDLTEGSDALFPIKE